MSPTKFFAPILLIGAGLLAVVAYIMLSQGLKSYAGLVGLIAAAGAVALLVGAAALYSIPSDRRGSVASKLKFGAAQRLLLAAIGIFSIGWATNAIATGKLRNPGRGPDVSVAKDPGKFWPGVALHLATGGICLVFAVRRQRKKQSTPKALRPSADRDA